jgi:hypothetical protein
MVNWHTSILFILQLIVVRKLEAFQNHKFELEYNVHYAEYAEYVKCTTYNKYDEHDKYAPSDKYDKYAQYANPFSICTPPF